MDSSPEGEARTTMRLLLLRRRTSKATSSRSDFLQSCPAFIANNAALSRASSSLAASTSNVSQKRTTCSTVTWYSAMSVPSAVGGTGPRRPLDNHAHVVQAGDEGAPVHLPA